MFQVPAQPFQRLQLRGGLDQLLLGFGHGLGVAAVGQHALGLVLGAFGRSLVDIARAQGRVGEYGNDRRLHFQNAARDVIRMTLAAGVDHLDRARFQQRDQRRMARRNAELASLAGGDDHAGLAMKNLGFGADDVAVDGAHVLFSESPVATGKREIGSGEWEPILGFPTSYFPFPTSAVLTPPSSDRRRPWPRPS